MSDTITATEPTHFSRDSSGLIPNLTYPRQPNGRIDWRALIPPQHIVFNTKNEKIAAEIQAAYGAPVKSLVYADVAAKQTVDDKHILVLLAGFEEVAELRGYTSSIPTNLTVGRSLRKRGPDVTYRDIEDTIVTASWTIDWIPNEEEPLGKTSGGTADATYENTGDFGYLSAMAGNRAFVRAVKKGLGIRILGFDEIAKKDDALPEAGQSPVGSAAKSNGGDIMDPHVQVKKTASECNFAFAGVKASAVKRWKTRPWPKNEKGEEVAPYDTDPETWAKFEDIPKKDCLSLIAKMREARARLDAQKAATAKAA